jgi:predicted ester cyclase
MSTESNKAASARLFVEAFGKGNMAVADELVAPGAKSGGPSTLPGQPDGPEGVKMAAAMYHGAFPNMQITIDEQVAEGDTVVTRWTAVGVNSGPMGDMPASGKSVTVTGMGIDHYQDGKIVSSWGVFDQMGMLVQMGVIPAPGG